MTAIVFALSCLLAAPEEAEIKRVTEEESLSILLNLVSIPSIRYNPYFPRFLNRAMQLWDRAKGVRAGVNSLN